MIPVILYFVNEGDLCLFLYWDFSDLAIGEHWKMQDLLFVQERGKRHSFVEKYEISVNLVTQDIEFVFFFELKLF